MTTKTGFPDKVIFYISDKSKYSGLYYLYNDLKKYLLKENFSVSLYRKDICFSKNTVLHILHNFNKDDIKLFSVLSEIKFKRVLINICHVNRILTKLQCNIIKTACKKNIYIIVNSKDHYKILKKIIPSYDKLMIIKRGVKPIDSCSLKKWSYKRKYEKYNKLFLGGFIRPTKGYHRIFPIVRKLNTFFKKKIAVVVAGSFRPGFYKEYKKDFYELIDEYKNYYPIFFKDKLMEQSLYYSILKSSDLAVLPYESGPCYDVIRDILSLKKNFIISDLNGFNCMGMNNLRGYMVRDDKDLFGKIKYKLNNHEKKNINLNNFCFYITINEYKKIYDMI